MVAVEWAIGWLLSWNLSAKTEPFNWSHFSLKPNRPADWDDYYYASGAYYAYDDGGDAP